MPQTAQLLCLDKPEDADIVFPEHGLAHFSHEWWFSAIEARYVRLNTYLSPIHHETLREYWRWRIQYVIYADEMDPQRGTVSLRQLL